MKPNRFLVVRLDFADAERNTLKKHRVPTRVHPDRQQAFAEAQRLAEAHPGARFGVFAQTGEFKVRRRVRVEEEVKG
jgi:hypothetical protein